MVSKAVRAANLKVTIAAIECEIVVTEDNLSQLRTTLGQLEGTDTEAVEELVGKIKAGEEVVKAAQLKLEGLVPTHSQTGQFHIGPLQTAMAMSGLEPGNSISYQQGHPPPFFHNIQGTAGQQNLHLFNQGGVMGNQGVSLDTPRPGLNKGRVAPSRKQGLSPVRSKSGERTFDQTFSGGRGSSDEESHPSSKPSRSRISKPRKYKKGDDICLFLDRFLDYTENTKLKDDRMDLQLVELIDDERMYRKMKKISEKLTMGETRRPESLVRAIKRLLFKEEGDLANTADLRNLVQGSKEQVEDFSFRIADAVTKIGVDDKEGDMLQATTFIQGLRPEIRDRMGSKAKSMKFDFNGLIDLAEKYEMQITRPRKDNPIADHNDFGEVYAMQKAEPEVGTVSTCKKCLKTGHDERTCWATIECQLCGILGHIASRCNKLKPEYATAPASRQQPISGKEWGTGGPAQLQTAPNGQFARGGENRACYNCGQVGHLSRACREPRADRGRETYRGGYNSGYGGSGSNWRHREERLNWGGAGGHSVPPAQGRNQRF